jgi:hypothetical protein
MGRATVAQEPSYRIDMTDEAAAAPSCVRRRKL